jgi:simple sugar transport system ATP-binding protein
MTVVQHMALGLPDPPRRALDLDWKQIAETADSLDGSVGLSMAGGHRILSSLSGGNIQRVLLTRALGRDDTQVIVAAYPSRGLDIATTRRTQELLLARRAAGAAILLISEDLDELLSLSDRITVMYAGRIAGTVAAATADRQHLGRLMLGSPS